MGMINLESFYSMKECILRFVVRAVCYCGLYISERFYNYFHTKQNKKKLQEKHHTEIDTFVAQLLFKMV